MDVVYLCRTGENEELRYSLRSLANLPHDRVWVFGGAPDWVRGVTVVPTFQRASKHAVTTRSLRDACNHPDVSDPFALFNDDFYVTAPCADVPVLHRGSVAHVMADYAARLGVESRYLQGMAETRDLLRDLGIAEPLSYELHVPLPVCKSEMLTALEIGMAAGIPVLHKRTMYGNLWGIGGRRIEDVKVFDWRRPVPRGPWLSSGDATFRRVRPVLSTLFPGPSCYELQPVTPAAQSNRRIQTKGVPVFTVTKRVYGQAESGRVVLMYTPGMVIPDDEARRVGLLAGDAKPEKPARGLSFKELMQATDEAPTPKSKPLSRMNLGELRAVCAAEGIDPDGANTRADFVALIEAARASADEG